MSEIAARLGERTIAITLPKFLLEDGILTSLGSGAAAETGDERIVVSQADDRSFTLETSAGHKETGLKRGMICARLLDVLAARFAELAHVPVLSAAAVGWGDGAILIAGPQGCGKSSLAAWFVEKGFALIADNQVVVADGASALAGYQAPLTFPAAGADHLTDLADIASAPMARTPKRIHVGIKDAWQALDGPHHCGMMIFPRHVPQGGGRVERLDAAEAALRLKAQLMPGCLPHDDTQLWHVRMAKDVPAIVLEYSSYEQIEGLLDRLTRLAIDDRLSPDEFNRFVSGIGHSPSRLTRKYPIPERSTRQFERFMTIGMATYDDYDGVYFSLQAIRLYHQEILDDVEFLLIDNHPDGPCSAELKGLEKHIANLRYIPAGEITGTAVRERVFAEAAGEFVLCMDCHVLFAPGSLKKLIDYFRSVPSTTDLIQGPMIYDDLETMSTHWTEGWRAGMFGKWANDSAGENPDNPPFAIPSHGLGVFACRRRAWPGFNPDFRGFGGEEGYIQEKFRRAGGRALCLPALRWLHRFARPMGAHYPNRWEDRIRNYLIGFREMGWDSSVMQAHFRELLGWQKANRLFAAAGKELYGGAGAKPLHDLHETDEAYDLSEARLRFVAEAAVPVLLADFAFDKAVCMGRAADGWVGEFSRHGIAAVAVQAADAFPAGEADMLDGAVKLACCFEVGGLSLAAAEEVVQRLTRMAATVVFVLPRPPRGADVNRARASWAALFARRGYRPIDCLRPVVRGDPRIDSHYQQNIAVFSSKTIGKERRTTGGTRHPPSVGAEPGVSVILPVYNGADFLDQAIESILLQTHRNLELIVVDDGSTDRSRAIAEGYAQADSRLRVIHQENAGDAAAFNTGFATSRFALVARLDHDDVALPERLARQVAFLERNEDIAVVGSALRCIDSEGKPTGHVVSYPLTPEACHAALVDTLVNPMGNPSVLMRKAALEQCGGLRAQFKNANDYDLWLRMDEHFKLANLPDPLVDYRSHGANTTVRSRFLVSVSAHIARQAAILRRRGEPDPVDGWITLGLEELAKFTMSDDERSATYRRLFDAALANFTATKESKYLNLADNCLSLSVAGQASCGCQQ